MESEQLIRGKAPLREVTGDVEVVSMTPTAAQDESIKELELYRYLNAAKHPDEFIKRIKSVLLPIGITDFAHVNCNNIADGLDSFGTTERSIHEQYGKEGFHLDDLATRHLMISDSPLFRSAVCNYVNHAPFDCEAFRRHRDADKFIREQGLLDVYNVPVVHEDYRSAVSYSSHMCEPAAFQEIVMRHRDLLNALPLLIDAIGRKRFKKHFHNPKTSAAFPVQPKPLQLLETLANKDLTLNEAAAVMNISISTANQHIAAAKRSLNAHTTHGLILAAQREGLLLVER